MKKLSSCIFAFTALSGFFMPHAGAKWIPFTGQVRMIQSSDSQQSIPGFISFVRIKGFNQGEGCVREDGENMLAVRDDEAGNRQFSSLLSSLIAGRTVEVTIDDAVKTQAGQCVLRWVRAQ